MGIYHFSGLFVLLCIGLSGSLLTSLGEHIFYRLVLPRIRRKKKFNYWLHTSQVRPGEGALTAPQRPLTPSCCSLLNGTTLPFSSPRLSPEPSPPDHHPPINPWPVNLHTILPNSLSPCSPQKIHRALNMGTEERKSQQLKLEQRYSWDWEPASLSSSSSSSLRTARALRGCRGTPEQPDPNSALPTQV